MTFMLHTTSKMVAVVAWQMCKFAPPMAVSNTVLATPSTLLTVQMSAISPLLRRLLFGGKDVSHGASSSFGQKSSWR